MSDFKSKLPDLKELGAITGKLYKDLKTSVNEIIQDYKQKREQSEKETHKPVKPSPKSNATTEEKTQPKRTRTVKKPSTPAEKIELTEKSKDDKK